MKSVLNFVLFQLVWFCAVGGAAQGYLWLGPAAVLGFLVVHLRMIPPGAGRGRELGYVLAVGLIGALCDSFLHAFGATVYPTSSEAWPFWIAPPWIVSLWVAFAMLPRFSLGWLRNRTLLAAVLGGLGGPLSYLGGTRIGSVALGESAALTLGALALEYAIVTPLLLRCAPAFSTERHTAESGRAQEIAAS